MATTQTMTTMNVAIKPLYDDLWSVIIAMLSIEDLVQFEAVCCDTRRLVQCFCPLTRLVRRLVADWKIARNAWPTAYLGITMSRLHWTPADDGTRRHKWQSTNVLNVEEEKGDYCRGNVIAITTSRDLDHFYWHLCNELEAIATTERRRTSRRYESPRVRMQETGRVKHFTLADYLRIEIAVGWRSAVFSYHILPHPIEFRRTKDRWCVARKVRTYSYGPWQPILSPAIEEIMAIEKAQGPDNWASSFEDAMQLPTPVEFTRFRQHCSGSRSSYRCEKCNARVGALEMLGGWWP